MADIYCTTCNTVLGWKYVSEGARGWQSLQPPACLAQALLAASPRLSCDTSLALLRWNPRYRQEMAYEESQKYKEGKFILEKAKVIKEGTW